MKCSSIILSAIVALIFLLGQDTNICQARLRPADYRLAIMNKNSRFLQRLLSSRLVASKIEPIETVPMSNEDLAQILDQLESNEISPLCLISENCATKFMVSYNFVLSKLSEKGAFLDFQFETNITEANEKEMNDFAPVSNRFQSIVKDKAFQFLKNSEDWNPKLRRMLFLAAQGIVFKNPEDVKKLASLTSELESIYATAKVCRQTNTRNKRDDSSETNEQNESIESNDDHINDSINKESSESSIEEGKADTSSPQADDCLSLEPGLTQIMQNSRDYDELKWAWTGWHNESGRKMRSIYTQTVQIQNNAARENNYTDLSDYWIDDFEDDQFEQNAAELFESIKPLYQKIHTYVRGKLQNVYGAHYPEWHDSQLIPAHLLGNMWAQTWENILDLVKPYPNAKATNVTQLLLDNNFTPKKMFKKAESFFTSIGLFEMTPEFWAYSMIEKPEGREVVCHASAIDYYNSRDFRIKMCTTVTGDQFNTIHHEMGHIEYYMAYKDQPAIFKTGANSAFHEAIGDTIALSVQTKKHLKAIGMVEDDSLTEEQHINYLMEIALQKVVFLPFAYLMDNWRWNVFRGKINESNYNQKWWDMRKELQGLEPPVPRSEQDFDPGAKYHIAAYVPYARYYISHFLQFQFYKSLCGYANHTGPLHTCDFYNSEEAGSHLKNMLELGASMHWSYALEKLSGQSKVTADAILEYFKPLSDWLEQQNLKQSNSNLVM